MRLLSPFFHTTPSSTHHPSMKLRLVQLARHLAYAICFFCFLTVLGGFHRLSKDSNRSLSVLLENPRFRRAILNSTPDRSNVLLESEGPLVELGPTLPQQLATDVFISVKTTRKYHAQRVGDIVDTWFRLAPENVSSLLICSLVDRDLFVGRGDRERERGGRSCRRPKVRLREKKSRRADDNGGLQS